MIEKIQPTECSCDRCKSMCMQSPCIGTLNDTLLLIQAGYEDKLKPTRILDKISGEILTIMAVEGEEWRHPKLPDTPLMKCKMQDTNGFCTLHKTGLKPTEGKLMNHNMSEFQSQQIRHKLLQTWKPVQHLLKTE